MGNKICFKTKTRERQMGVFAHWAGAGDRGWTTVCPEGSVFSTSSWWSSTPAQLYLVHNCEQAPGTREVLKKVVLTNMFKLQGAIPGKHSLPTCLDYPCKRWKYNHYPYSFYSTTSQLMSHVLCTEISSGGFLNDILAYEKIEPSLQ